LRLKVAGPSSAGDGCSDCLFATGLRPIPAESPVVGRIIPSVAARWDCPGVAGAARQTRRGTGIACGIDGACSCRSNSKLFDPG